MSKTSSQSATKPKDIVASTDDEDNLTVFVQDLLEQMQSRFQQMTNTIVSRIDDMGSRIDELEKSIGDLMSQAGITDDRGVPGLSDDSRLKKDSKA